MPPLLLECRDVTVYRGETRVLDRLSLSIAVGEHVAILGPNGCGKSTLIKTITRECYPAVTEPAATLRILGQDTWDVTTLRRLLGIVTNDLVAECTRGLSSDFAELPRRITGADTVLSGFFSSIGVSPRHIVTSEMRERASEILAQLGASHLAEKPLHAMSSGEARRCVIGRALAHEPAALVLDEYANSLDLRATHDLRGFVRSIAQRGTNVVLVTHHLAEIVPEVSRVILMRAGRVVADGPKADVLTSDVLSDLFGVPVEVFRRGDDYFAV